MIGAGIVDPAKVTRSALENAASVSSMVLTTEALVADKPEPPHPRLPPAWAAWTACTKRHRKALKLLDFLDTQKRIYAKLTPLTPKIQAHDRVMKTDTHICGCRSFARAAMTSKHCQGCEGKCVLSRNRHIPRAMEDLKEF